MQSPKPEPDSDSLLALRGVSKRYGGVSALAQVDLWLRRGEIHALVGENGAGKSTLIGVLAGLIEADEGQLFWCGQVQREHSAQRARNLGIAVLHQVPRLFAELSVAENLLLERVGFWVRRSAMQRQARELLERVEVQLDPETRAGDLSLAEQQLVALARALNQGARLIVLDEPTAVLPAHEAAQLLARMRRLREQGVSLLFVSHRLDEVLQYSDVVTVLRDGVRVDYTKTAAVSRAQLIQSMVGQRPSELSRGHPRPRGENLLSVAGLSAAAGGLSDISFELARGEVLALAGLVGAGRSELLRCLVGLERMHTGRVLLLGKEIRPKNPRAALALGIALVPEDRRRQGSIAPFSVQENLSLPQLGKFAPYATIRTRRERTFAAELCTRLQIKCAGLDEPLTHLSGGNQQKVVLARWLACNPRLLLLDEPTQGIDVAGRAEIHETIRREVQRGTAVLLASSDWNEIRELADRVAVLRAGSLQAILPADAPTGTLLDLAFGRR